MIASLPWAGVVQGEKRMKIKLNYGSQLCAGLALRSNLRVGGYNNVDAYIQAFNDTYPDCNKIFAVSPVPGLCVEKSWDFYYKCNAESNQTGICNEGRLGIANYWDHGLYRELPG